MKYEWTLYLNDNKIISKMWADFVHTFYEQKKLLQIPEVQCKLTVRDRPIQSWAIHSRLLLRIDSISMICMC